MSSRPKFRRVIVPKEGRVGQSLATSGSKPLSPMMVAATWASLGQRRQAPHVVSPKVIFSHDTCLKVAARETEGI